MKRWAAAIALVAAACGGTGGRSTSNETDPADRGHELYLEGKLDAAAKDLSGVVSRDPKNRFARRLLGRIYLLQGRHRESADQFLSYLDLVRRADVPVDGLAVQDLFWASYRMDDYATAAKAAALLDDSVLSVKYREMANRGAPYTTDPVGGSATLSFEEMGLASARVNRIPGRFALDLGAGEMVLTRAFAKDAGVRLVGVPSPGIERREQGVVESIDFPGLQVRNVPVVVSDVRGASDGVIGIGLLSHFQATVDLRRNRLILRPASSPPREGETWPLLFAGDRTLLAPATVDGIETLVIVNPTARKVRFVPSAALIVEKARRFKDKPALERIQIGATSMVVDEQSTDAFPPGVDVAYGFIIGGMVGAEAFRNRAVTFDFRAMKITIE